MAVEEQIYRSGGSAPAAAPMPGMSPEAFGAGIGQAIEGAGGQLEASSMRALQARRSREEEAGNAQAAAGVAQLSIDLSNMAADKREDPATPLDGSGHVEAVTAEADARITKFLEGIPDQRVRQHWATRVAELRGSLVENEDGWARGRRIESIGTNAKDAGRLWDNHLQSNPDPALFEQSLAAGDTFWSGVKVSADVRDKGIKEWKASRASNFLEGMIEKDPVAAKVLITHGALDEYLDAKDKRSLLDKSDTEIRIAEADARRAQTQQVQQLNQDITDYKQRVDRGEVPDDKEPQALVSRAQALGLTHVVDDITYTQGKAKLSRETDKWTANDWETNVNELAAKVASGKASPDEEVKLRALQDLRPNKEARFRNDPQGFAAASGIPAPVVDLENPTPTSISARKSWARAYAGTAGLVEPPYLDKDQLAAYRDRTRQGPVAQFEVASELRQTWGDAALSIVRQIGGEPVAGMQLMLGLSPRFAQVYSHGAEALAKNVVKLNEPAMREVFHDYARAIPPDLAPAVFDTARTITAGWMNEKGYTDPPANFNDVFRQALSRAVGQQGGGGYDGSSGGFDTWNGRWIVLPPDMRPRDFGPHVSRASAEQWVASNVDERGNLVGKRPYLMSSEGKLVPATVGQVGRFKLGHFQTVSPGIYQVLGPSGEPVLDYRGQPWLFDVRRLP